MKTVINPNRDEWASLVERPAIDNADLESAVADILRDVSRCGDEAVRRFALRFDGVELDSLEVTEAEFIAAEEQVSRELKEAIAVAKANIEKFHSAQREIPSVVETTAGVSCWRRSVPIGKVGLYIPSGTAPLFSTVLMLAIPAKQAGCGEIVACSGPDRTGAVNPVTLYAAKLCGVTRFFKISGAQAVGAMAFGTSVVPKVDKIFGPGNQFVTEAKMQVSKTGTAIDMPAGPSEVAVLADETCVPAFVAADLLSQAEHGADSQVVLVSTSRRVVEEVAAEVTKQIESLPRKAVAEQSLANSTAILFDDLATSVEFLNEYAAEHLIIATENADAVAQSVVNAGSVFIGNFSCESAGDYASGTNHTLPTNGWARSYSGVSLDSFVKKITYQKISEDGMRNLGPHIETMAAAEQLEAHKRAVTLRLEALKR